MRQPDRSHAAVRLHRAAPLPTVTPYARLAPSSIYPDNAPLSGRNSPLQWYPRQWPPACYCARFSERTTGSLCCLIGLPGFDQGCQWSPPRIHSPPLDGEQHVGLGFPLPFDHRHWLLGHPVPAPEIDFPSGQPTAPTARTRTGFPRSTCARPSRGGCRLYPGTAVSTRPVKRPDRRAPLPSGQSCTPVTRQTHHTGPDPRAALQAVPPTHWGCPARHSAHGVQIEDQMVPPSHTTGVGVTIMKYPMVSRELPPAVLIRPWPWSWGALPTRMAQVEEVAAAAIGELPVHCINRLR